MQRLRYSRYFKSAMILLDLFVFAVIVLFFIYRSSGYALDIRTQEKNLIIVLILCSFWTLLSGKTNIYSVPRNLTFTNYLERNTSHIFIFTVVIIIISSVLESSFFKTHRFIISIALLIVLLFLKSIIFFFLKYARSKGINHRNVMFLNDNSSTEILKNIINKRKDYGYRIFEYPNENINVNHLKKFWMENGIHTLFLPSENKLDKTLESKIFEEAEAHKIKISLIPNIIQNEFFSYELNYIESLPILSPVKFPLEYFTNYLVKRIFDIIVSLLFLLFIGVWLFPIIALLIKINGGKGPVFFIQKRYGFHNEVFNCLKFRTMYENDESSLKTTEVNDSRITPVGKFLRKTSLDETPQFINVLLGDMSVVGPRPHMTLVDDNYKSKISRYTVRSQVKPGVTGLAQVSGLRGDRENMEIEMKKRVLADSFYVRNWSFSLDLVIIFKTIVLLIEGDKNAH